MTFWAPMTGVHDDSMIVVFRLDEQRCALWLSRVERVIPLVTIARLPGAPSIVLGVINVGGALLPVVDPRRRFGWPSREPELSDHLLISETKRRRLALLVDAVEGPQPLAARDWSPLTEVAPGAGYVAGVANVAGRITFIHDLDAFLSLDEERALDAAVGGAAC